MEVGAVSVTSGETGTAAKWNRDTKGIIARGRRVTDSTGSASTTFVPVLRLDDIPLTAGRCYRISTAPLGVDGNNANDIIRVTITYTTDGSTPTISSTTLPGGRAQALQANISNGEYLYISTTYTPASDETLSLLLCVSRQSGAGTVVINGDSVNTIEMVVEDIGVDPGDTGTDL
jgi:hypothetical protein